VRQGRGGRPGRAMWRREKERRGGEESAAGPWGRDGSGRHCRRRQRTLVVEAGWRTGEGRRGAVDVVQARLTGGAGWQRGPVVSGEVQERAGEKSRAVTGHRQAGPGSTVLGDADSKRI
jgi:hypothetical protein